MCDVVREIQEKLREIELKQNVRILHAVESGSRAWGFASPDSDYDVRFIYVRNLDDYLRLDQPWDMIEWQLDEVLDINGWDLKKVLLHFYRCNVTLFEWSNSPIVYQTTSMWEQIYDQARQYFFMKAAANQYYGTANSTYKRYLQGDRANYKKYFYALRPLLAVRYIQDFHCAPPVLFDDLMKLEIPAELRAGIEELLELKKRSDESAEGLQIPVIRDFIAAELKAQKISIEGMENDRKQDWEPLNELFRKAVYEE